MQNCPDCREAAGYVRKIYDETWKSNSMIWQRLHALSLRALIALKEKPTVPQVRRAVGRSGGKHA